MQHASYKVRPSLWLGFVCFTALAGHGAHSRDKAQRGKGPESLNHLVPRCWFDCALIVAVQWCINGPEGSLWASGVTVASLLEDADLLSHCPTEFTIRCHIRKCDPIFP